MSARPMRWLAYARWQLVDGAWQRLALPLVLAMLLCYAAFYSLKGQAAGHPEFWTTSDGLRFTAQLLRQAMGTFIPLAVLMGTNGMVAQDRQKGYFRFFFSKPVPVTGFYLSSFVVQAALVMAGAALVAAFIGSRSTPQPVLAVALAAGLTYALLGSLLFLLSTLTYHDGLVFILAWVLTLIVRQIEPALRPGHWMHAAVRVLPPTHRLDAVRDALYAAQPVAAADVWHVLAYGGACVALALVALRRLPLAR
ncbi:MAG: hypothetical protein ACYC3L_06345 [Gemmatimonadaceae bacterium]